MPWNPTTKPDLFVIFDQSFSDTAFGDELDRLMGLVSFNYGDVAIERIENTIADYQALDSVFKSQSMGQGTGQLQSRGPLAEVGKTIKFHKPSDNSDVEWSYKYAYRQRQDWLNQIKSLLGLEDWLKQNVSNCCNSIRFV